MVPQSSRYFVDLLDPRAPSQEVWDSMSEDDRRRVVDSLPSEFAASEASPPEGDHHYDAVKRVREMLRGYYGRIRRKVYVGNDLPVYYPDAPMFAPDVMVVLDAEDHPRNAWVVSAEGRGLDLAIEVYYRGSRAKDLERNVTRYATLGITEYFVFDVRGLRLRGYRLSGGDRSYVPLMPQAGRFCSAVLGLDLCVEGDRLRFYHGSAALPDAEDLILRLDAALEAVKHRAEEEAHRAEEEAHRAEEEARRAEEAECRLREALAELEQLRTRS